MAGDIKDGRPLKFKTKEELEEKIQAYFDSCFEEKWTDEEMRDAEGNRMYVRVGSDTVPGVKHIKKRIQIKPVTITGLAYALDTSRKVLLDYQNDEDFSNTITRAKQFIENLTEERLMSGDTPPNAAIFNMKNNWGWKDEVHSVNRTVELTEEQKRKWDEILMDKKPEQKNEATQPTSPATASDSKQSGT